MEVVMNDHYWMKKAYDQALIAQNEGEVPVGAVLIDERGVLLAAAGNAVLKSHDPSAHAEVQVIRQASQVLKNHRLINTTLYVTLEPCPMCTALMVHARIKRLVYATRDFKTGAAGSVFNLVQGYPLNHKIQSDEGIMQHECALLLSEFFKTCR